MRERDSFCTKKEKLFSIDMSDDGKKLGSC